MRIPMIVAIDDSPEVLLSLGQALDGEFDLRVAASAAEGLAIAAELVPDLILLDVVMPELDGYAVIAELKKSAPLAAIPVIFLTSLVEQADEASCLAAGAVDFVAKPFNSAVLSARVSAQIKLKQQADTLRVAAVVDGLTGLGNRRALDEAIAIECAASRRENAPIALLMIDIDHFKQFNDQFGHPLGDRCLQSVAAAISSQIRRPRDFIARYGGEEFCCLLPATDAAGAAELAEKIRRAVADNRRCADGQGVTVSIGVAACWPAGHDCSAALLTAADGALYGAKQGGRNQVLVASTEPGL